MANEFQDIGREIRDAVLDAVSSGDYSELNTRIRSSVNAAIDEVNERLNAFSGTAQKSRDVDPGRAGEWRQEPTEEPPKPAFKQKVCSQGSAYRVPPTSTVRRVNTVRTGTPPGPAFREKDVRFQKTFKDRALGVLIVFSGVLAMLCFGVAEAWIPLAAAGALLGIGIGKLGFIERYRQYTRLLRTKTYCAISELARDAGRSERFVLRDLRLMIRRGLFPQGHIDDEGKTLLLTDGVYDEYRLVQRQRAALEQEVKSTAQPAPQPASAPQESEEERYFRETLEQGEHYRQAIRRANDAIPGEVVSEKLFRLEDVVGKIFAQVKAHPEQISELRRFLDYYMPTTLKLVETYEELDRQPIAGENIRRSKEEIEKTLDTINLAFENLFDSLFEHTAVDITSDISVLKTMLKQEGLTERDFVT